MLCARLRATCSGEEATTYRIRYDERLGATLLSLGAIALLCIEMVLAGLTDDKLPVAGYLDALAV